MVDRVLLDYVKFPIPKPCYTGRKRARFWSSVIARSTRQIVKSWDAYTVTLPTVTLTHRNPSPRSAVCEQILSDILSTHSHARLFGRSEKKDKGESYHDQLCRSVDRIMVMLKSPPPLLRQRRRSCGPHAARCQIKDNTQTHPLPFYLTAAKVSAPSLSELCATKGGGRE